MSRTISGALIASFALLGVLLFHDWGAKFYFNAAIASVIALLAFFMLRDTPQSCGLPAIEEYKNDYPEDYFRGEGARLHVSRNFSRSVVLGTQLEDVVSSFGERRLALGASGELHRLDGLDAEGFDDGFVRHDARRAVHGPPLWSSRLRALSKDCTAARDKVVGHRATRIRRPQIPDHVRWPASGVCHS